MGSTSQNPSSVEILLPELSDIASSVEVLLTELSDIASSVEVLLTELSDVYSSVSVVVGLMCSSHRLTAFPLTCQTVWSLYSSGVSKVTYFCYQTEISVSFCLRQSYKPYATA